MHKLSKLFSFVYLPYMTSTSRNQLVFHINKASLYLASLLNLNTHINQLCNLLISIIKSTYSFKNYMNIFKVKSLSMFIILSTKKDKDLCYYSNYFIISIKPALIYLLHLNYYLLFKVIVKL